MPSIPDTCETAGHSTVEPINLPDVRREVTAVLDRYERALVSNDVTELDALFWTNRDTVRYGASECLYGHQEILNFRKNCSPKGLMRTVIRRSIATYGKSFATCSLEFVRDSEPRIGRQSQTWVKFSYGWRVVQAHVSWMDLPRLPEEK